MARHGRRYGRFVDAAWIKHRMQAADDRRAAGAFSANPATPHTPITVTDIWAPRVSPIVVDVALVPVPGQSIGPVVEVQLVPLSPRVNTCPYVSIPIDKDKAGDR